MSRVVVIGAGVGGLAAAARLAAGGHDVTVCERAEVVGGKLGLLERHTAAGTFRFDTGPSLLTMPEVFADLFAATGDPWPAGLDLQPLDPLIRHRFADGTRLDTSGDLDTTCARMDAAFGPPAGADWRRLLARSEQIWTAVRRPFLESPIDGVRDLARQAVRVGDLRTIAPGRTLRWLGERYLTDPRQRVLLDRYATYTGSDPRRAPAALGVVPYLEQRFGGWYLGGGLRTLADELARRVTALGGRIRTGTEVARIETEGGRAAGVLLADGGRLPADVVVANADAGLVYRDLLPRPALARRLRKAVPSLSGFVMLLGVRGRTPNLAHHNVLFPASYDAEFDAVFGDPATPVADPTIYVSVPDDPAVRPDGHEAWFVLVNAPRHGTGPGALNWDSPALSGSYAGRLLGLLARRGLPVTDRLLFSHVITPADLARATRAPGGAIYGSSSNGARAAFLRPPNRSPVRGLFLVGGSTHPGGGLPLVVLSARIVDTLIGPA
ncbi:MAG TPA: phytoene desaturase family protein [Mycobacteriales bacterium]|nr:phytoene desaturase family protein [Mycobacteriales bacterium]